MGVGGQVSGVGPNPALLAVLLDVGGIILDETKHEAVRAEITVKLLSRIVPDYDIQHYHSDIEEAVARFAPKTYRYVFWKHLKPDISAYEQLYAAYTTEFDARKLDFPLVDGIANEIKALGDRFKIGLAGQYGRFVLEILEQHGVLGCLENHLTQDDFSITKPDPRYLEQIARLLKVEPKDCIMVGDRLDNDIIPAKMLGMNTVLIRTGIHRNQQPRLPSEIPDVELQSVIGLADAIARLVDGSPNH